MKRELLYQSMVLIEEAKKLESLNGAFDKTAEKMRQTAAVKLEEYELEVLAHACNTTVKELEHAIEARIGLNKNQTIQKQADEIAQLKAKIDKMTAVVDEIQKDLINTLT